MNRPEEPKSDILRGHEVDPDKAQAKYKWRPESKREELQGNKKEKYVSHACGPVTLLGWLGSPPDFEQGARVP